MNAWVVGEGIHPDHASVMEPFGNAVHATFGTEGGEDLLTNPVAVIGCGPIGLFAVGIARALGAWKVIAIEPNDERRSLAAKMGADLLIDPKADDPVEAVLDATDGNGAEVVLEMSGNATAIDQGTRLLARGGRMSLLGLPDGPVTLDLNDQVIFKEARILGITGREMFRTWQQTTTLLSTGRVDISPVITHRFPLDGSRRRSRRPRRATPRRSSSSPRATIRGSRPSRSSVRRRSCRGWARERLTVNGSVFTSSPCIEITTRYVARSRGARDRSGSGRSGRSAPRRRRR